MHLLHQVSTVTAICPEMFQVGKARLELGNHQIGSIAILNTDGGDHLPRKQAQRIHGDVVYGL
jgi:hypothetical protein